MVCNLTTGHVTHVFGNISMKQQKILQRTENNEEKASETKKSCNEQKIMRKRLQKPKNPATNRK